MIVLLLFSSFVSCSVSVVVRFGRFAPSDRLDSWRSHLDFASVQERRHSVTDDTLALHAEHLVLFEVTIATTTQ